MLIVVNNTKWQVSLGWIDDEDGKEERYAVLDPGEEYRQETYPAHKWRVRRHKQRGGRARGKAGKLLCELVASSEREQRIDVQKYAEPPVVVVGAVVVQPEGSSHDGADAI